MISSVLLELLDLLVNSYEPFHVIYPRGLRGESVEQVGLYPVPVSHILVGRPFTSKQES